MFRALVSAGLNRQKLLYWVRLVVRCPELVDKHYERFSFLARTGMSLQRFCIFRVTQKMSLCSKNRCSKCDCTTICNIVFSNRYKIEIFSMCFRYFSRW